MTGDGTDDGTGHGTGDDVRRLRLPVRGPLALPALRGFLAAHVVDGLEHHDAASGRHTRLVPTGSGPAVVTVHLSALVAGPGAPDGTVEGAVAVDVALPRAGDEGALLPEVAVSVARWLDLGTDGTVVDAALAAHPPLRPLVLRRPGLRVPGSVDPFETAVTAVLGQQVSLRAARTFAARLVAAFGRPGPGGLALLPDPAALVTVGADRVRAATGVTGARARALVALAAAAPLGGPPDGDLDAAAARLLAVPGVGPWTVAYVRMRGWRDADAFLAGDLVLRRALGVTDAREAERAAAAWRPWRAYAAMHLWTEAVPALSGHAGHVAPVQSPTASTRPTARSASGSAR